MSVKPGVGKGQRSYIRLFSGADFNFDLKDNCYLIGDIAHALSNIGRYVGHTDTFYSVAQHSLHVSEQCVENPLWGLLHDAAEAYLGDVSSPLKAMLPDYKKLELRVMRQICRTFDLPPREPDEVKQADLRLLATEGRDLFTSDAGWPWREVSALPLNDRIKPMFPSVAETHFLTRYYRLRRIK